MSQQEAVIIENLSKSYRINRPVPAESGGSSLKRRLRSFRDWARGDETFWALDDVSFSVRPGEVVG